MSPIAWPGMGLGPSIVNWPLAIQSPLAGLPFTDTMSPMKMFVMKFLIFPVTILGDVASLEGSARSLTYPTKFSASMSKVANCGVCAHACPKATAQKAAVRMRFHLLVVIFMVEISFLCRATPCRRGRLRKQQRRTLKVVMAGA